MKSRPTTERLEFRRLFACLVFTNGDVLNIVGDNTANNIQVAVRPNAATPGANVTCDGVNTPIATPIHTVNILSNGGDDQISVQFGAPNFRPTFTPPLLFQMATGDGNDTAAVTAYGGTGDGGSLGILMGGGVGNDQLSATVNVETPDPTIANSLLAPGILSDPGVHLNIQLGGAKGDDTLTADVHHVFGRSPVILNDDQIVVSGGEGNDQLTANITGQRAVDSSVFIGVTGDAGDDRISSLLALGNPTGGLPDGIAATLGTEVNLLGGDGNDRIDFSFGAFPFRPNFDPAFDTTITIDGGAGIDVITSTVHAGSAPGKASFNITGGLATDVIRATFDIAPNRSPEIAAPPVTPTIASLPLELNVDIDGGNAIDLIDVSVTQFNDATAFPDDSFNIKGGAQNDRITFSYTGDVPTNTTLDVTLDGGADNDSIVGNFNFSGLAPLPGSTHRTVNVLGGTGNDALTLLGVGLGTLTTDVVTIDGGAGFDVCFTNVATALIQNCEL